ncbi:MAG: hypothetical protein QXS51_04180 [Thermoproteota archaeon]|nr:hypothetical protein [Candidatus Brockarchaeota archaeon]
MRFFEFIFELLSPAIVTKRLTDRGFHLPLDHIPPMTLRGAILTAFFREGRVDKNFLSKEVRSPELIVSPAYPFVEGRKSYPCHPFAYKCKVPHGDSLEVINYATKIIHDLEAEREPQIEFTCSRGHSTIEGLHPKPVIPFGPNLKEVRILFHEAISVGINKHKASSERNMLFDYEAIAAGQKFWATLALPNEKLEINEGFEFFIGRGISRGFGRSRVTSVKEVNLNEEVEHVKNSIKNKAIVLYALSPLLSSRDVISSPYPTEMCSGKLLVDRVYGRMTSLHCGWDMMSNKERPTLKASNPGSVIVARVSNGLSLEEIAKLVFLGTVEWAAGFAIVGVNMLTPLSSHAMGGESE